MKKNSKLTLLILALGVVLSTAARVFVISAHTDMNTGFLYHGDELLCNLLYYGVIVIASAAAVFTARLDENSGIKERSAADISGAGTALIGFLTIFAGVFAVYEGITEIDAITPNKFLMFADFIFGAVQVALAFVTLVKKKFTPGVGYSYSLIGVYCICRGIYCFMNRMAITTVPEYLIECMSLIGMAVFFVLLGRFLSGNETPRTRKALSFWGVLTASLTLSNAFGVMIAKLTAPSSVSGRIVYTSFAAERFKQAQKGIDAYNMVFSPWVNLLLGALTAVALVVLFAGRTAKSDEDV